MFIKQPLAPMPTYRLPQVPTNQWGKFGKPKFCESHSQPKEEDDFGKIQNDIS